SIGHLPLVIVGGVVSGVWSLRRKGERAEIRVETAHALNAKQRHDLEGAATRIGETIQAEVTLSYGAGDARPHASQGQSEDYACSHPAGRASIPVKIVPSCRHAVYAPVNRYRVVSPSGITLNSSVRLEVYQMNFPGVLS